MSYYGSSENGKSKSRVILCAAGCRVTWMQLSNEIEVTFCTRYWHERKIFSLCVSSTFTQIDQRWRFLSASLTQDKLDPSVLTSHLSSVRFSPTSARLITHLQVRTPLSPTHTDFIWIITQSYRFMIQLIIFWGIFFSCITFIASLVVQVWNISLEIVSPFFQFCPFLYFLSSW